MKLKQILILLLVLLLCPMLIGAVNPSPRESEHVTVSFDRFDALLRDTMELKEKIRSLQQAVAAPPQPPPPPSQRSGLPDSINKNGRIVRNSHVEVDVTADQKTASATHRFTVDLLPLDVSKPGEKRWHSIALTSELHVISGRRITSNPVPQHFFSVVDDMQMLLVQTNANETTTIEVEFLVFHHIVKQFSTHTLTVQGAQPFESLSLHFRNRSTSPAEDIQITPRAFASNNQFDPDTVDVRMSLASTSEITWRSEKSIDDDERNNSTTIAPMSSTLESLYSVSDDGVQGFLTIQYNLDSDQTTTDKFAVAIYGAGSGLRVSTVTGLNLDRWTVQQVPASEADDAHAIIHVQLQTPIARNTYRLAIRLEMSLNQDLFSLPVVQPLHSVRNSGRLFVTTSKNTVEIKELSAAGVAIITDKEFSEELRMQTNRPPLLSYSYVTADYDVLLKRKTHSIMENVINAYADVVHETIHVADHYSMHSVRGVLRNLRQQFLTVRLPASLVAVWGVSVNSDTVSPSTHARTEANETVISIPLLSTLRREFDDESIGKSTFDIVYITKNDESLQSNGKWSITLAQPDVPMTVQQTTIRFPAMYETKWETTMKRAHAVVSAPTRIESKRTQSHIVQHSSQKFFYVNENFQNQYQILEDVVAQFPSIDISLPPADAMRSFSFVRQLVQSTDSNLLTAHYAIPIRSSIETARDYTMFFWNNIGIMLQIAAFTFTVLMILICMCRFICCSGARKHE